MSEVVIQAENISKQYQIGVLNSGSLKKDLQFWWKNKYKKSLRNSDDGFENPHTILALSGINFTINKGEVVGFVGNNGAGKSTLLKIISNITSPTTGVIRGMGSIASLLEVGTGFHPELTGKENIFLNGHLLGMNKQQINQQLEEIIDFSGVEQFIDTPVKRYSTGMYVRLAFSVAAHIDPDILIIDEALAVGDADFQQKCIKKMNQVAARKDKTIIFVSHDLASVQQLCTTAYWLNNGKIVSGGHADKIVNQYINASKHSFLKQVYSDLENAPGNEFIRIKSALLMNNASDTSIINTNSSLKLAVEFNTFFSSPEPIMVALLLFTFSGTPIFDLNSPITEIGTGLYSLSFSIPRNFLNEGSYCISLTFLKKQAEIIYKLENCVHFTVTDAQETHSDWFRKNWGAVKPNFPIQINKHL